MANLHSVVDIPPLPGSASPQPLRLSPFPKLAFPECSSESPLDLNSSQKLLQSASKSQNAFERNLSYKSEQRELEASPSAYIDIGPNAVPEIVMSDGAVDGAPSKIAQRSRCHWSHNEVMALFNAKKAEADKYDIENVDNEKAGKKMRISSERWDEVAEFCKARGANKLASQCKDKWERIWLAFRKISDWERQPPSGKGSFWAMQGDEREKEGFPRVFDKELYDALAARFGFVKSLDISTIVVDSSIVEESVDAATNTGNEPLQNQTQAIEESPSVVDDQALTSTGRKRKSTPRRSIRHTLTDTKKRTVFGENTVEENGVPRLSKDQNWKSKGGDFDERKLLLEERKLKLAEKRFQLEERKLEATIEIGKGLITSMERMTHTISSLGVFSSHQQ